MLSREYIESYFAQDAWSDLWMSGAGLLVLNTTHHNFNEFLYSLITSKSILTRNRTLHAIFSSETGEEWTREFIRENSGTTNNQYLFVDTKKFVPKY
jgi:hypothetical protein